MTKEIPMDEMKKNELIYKHCSIFQNTANALLDHFEEQEQGYNYLASKQFDKKRYEWHKSNERPARSFNIVFPSFAAVLGDFLYSDNDMKVRPQPGGTQHLADIFQQVLDQLSVDSDVNLKMARTGIAGMIKQGFMYPNFNSERILEGEVTIDNEDEFDILYDPRARNQYLDDAAYQYRSKWMSKSTLMSKIPHLRSVIEKNLSELEETGFWETVKYGNYETLARGQLFLDEKDGLYRVIECHTLEWEENQVAVMPDGAMEIFRLDGKKADLYRMANPGMKIIRRQAKAKRVFTFIPSLNLAVSYKYSPLQDQEHDFIAYSGYSLGRYAHENYGLFRHRRDPQDDFNDHRNVGLNILNKMADPGMLLKRDALENPTQFSANRRRPGNIGYVRNEWEMGDVYKVLDFSRMPDAMLNQSEKDLEFINSVIGPSPNFFGQSQTSNENASLYAQRVRENKKTLQMIYESWKGAKKRAYRKVIRLIQLNYDSQRYLRVLNKEAGVPIEIPINTNELNRIGIGRYEIIPDRRDRSQMARVLRFFEKNEVVDKLATLYGPTAIDNDWWLEDAGIGDMSKVIDRANEAQQMLIQQQNMDSAFSELNATVDLAQKNQAMQEPQNKVAA